MYITELTQVLMWRVLSNYNQTIKSFYTEHGSNTSDPDLPLTMGKAYFINKIKTKDAFIQRIDDYLTHCTIEQSEAELKHCVRMTHEEIKDAMTYGTSESGALRHQQFTKYAAGWAFHLDDYGKAVNNSDGLTILELGTGAGMGTWAVMKDFSTHINSRLVSIDIDYPCIKNADGIAKYLNLSERVCGINAGFWSLPFADGIFDCVCSHYAIDESTEIQRTLQEAARVLKPGGRLVLLTRTNPYDRQKRFMEPFGITPEECNDLLKKARLFSGVNDLINTAKGQELELASKVEYTPNHSHHRMLCVFVRRQNEAE
jgi:ubiquinone/menaquinone biosynthesis C-methylase UbiE